MVLFLWGTAGNTDGLGLGFLGHRGKVSEPNVWVSSEPPR